MLFFAILYSTLNLNLIRVVLNETGIKLNKRKKILFGASIFSILFIFSSLVYADTIKGKVGTASESASEDSVPATLELTITYSPSKVFDTARMRYVPSTGELFTLSTGGGAFVGEVSTDKGQTWTAITMAANSADFFITSEGTYLRANGFDTTTVDIDRSINQGSSWTSNVFTDTVSTNSDSRPSCTSTNCEGIDHFGEDILVGRIWFSYNGNIAYSDDDGVNWTQSTQQTCNGGEGVAAWNGHVVIGDFNEGIPSACAGISGTSLRPVISNNNGVTWTQISSCTSCSGFRGFYAPQWVGGTVYAGHNANIFSTYGLLTGGTDGTSWSTLTALGSNASGGGTSRTQFEGYETNQNIYLFAIFEERPTSGTNLKRVLKSSVPVSSWTTLDSTTLSVLEFSDLVRITPDIFFYDKADTFYRIKP